MKFLLVGRVVINDSHAVLNRELELSELLDNLADLSDKLSGTGGGAGIFSVIVIVIVLSARRRHT